MAAALVAPAQAAIKNVAFYTLAAGRISMPLDRLHKPMQYRQPRLRRLPVPDGQASARWDAVVGVVGILGRRVSAGRAFRVCQATGSAGAECAGNSPKRAADHHTDRTSNCRPNGRAGGHAGHDAAPHQG